MTRERLYLENMEEVLQNSNKLYMGSDSNNLMMLPLDKMTGSTTNSGLSKTEKREGAVTIEVKETTPTPESIIQNQPNNNVNDQRSRARFTR